MGSDRLGTVQSLDEGLSIEYVSSLNWFELGYHEDGKSSLLATIRH